MSVWAVTPAPYFYKTLRSLITQEFLNLKYHRINSFKSCKGGVLGAPGNIFQRIGVVVIVFKSYKTFFLFLNLIWNFKPRHELRVSTLRTSGMSIKSPHSPALLYTLRITIKGLKLIKTKFIDNKNLINMNI